LTATTIHRLLKVGPSDDGYDFACTKFSPLEQKVFILDEASMVDTDLFAHLLSALPPAAHLFLVGDPNQLTPVGHGAPLRDMLSVAALPRGELTEIKRNAGLIVTACRDLKDDKPYETCARFDKHAGLNLRHVPCGTPEAAIETVESILASVLGGRKWDVLDDCQVIVAVNDKSPLARKKLNGVLQNLLNPSGRTAGQNPFRVGDKAICLKNGLNIPLRAVYYHNGSPMLERTHHSEAVPDVTCLDERLGREWFRTEEDGENNCVAYHDLSGRREDRVRGQRRDRPRLRRGRDG
jgi:exodeoxyribonuclease V alpha subunit